MNYRSYGPKFGIVLGALLGFAALSPVNAQQIVARVNGEPITAIDLAQRSRLLQLSGGGKVVGRQHALDELIDQELKLQTARRYKIDIGDAEVNQAFQGMASRVGTDSVGFTKQLEHAGISVPAFKRKLMADLVWNNIVRGKFAAELQIRDRDVTDAIRSQGKTSDTAYNFKLYPILLVVQQGAGPAGFEARRKEAEGLRNRFQGCEEGLKLARGLRDVAVRPPITRNSGDVSSKQRELLEGTAVGRLTPPDVTANGIEVFAVCDKTAAKGAFGAERDMREQMMGDKMQAEAKRYLQQLRRQASIQIL